MTAESEDPGSVTEPLSHIPTSSLLGLAKEPSSAVTDSISWSKVSGEQTPKATPALVRKPADGDLRWRMSLWHWSNSPLSQPRESRPDDRHNYPRKGISGSWGPRGLILSTP